MMKVILDVEYMKKHTIHKTGNSNTLVIPKRYVPNSKNVEVVIGTTSKGNKLLLVKL